MTMSDEERKLIADLTASNNRLAQETAVQNNQMKEIRDILFGQKADGFLYEFAALRKDIESIPSMAHELRMMAGQLGDVLNVIPKLTVRVKAIDKYILRQRLRHAVQVSVLSIFMSGATLVAGAWSGLWDLLATFRGHK